MDENISCWPHLCYGFLQCYNVVLTKMKRHMDENISCWPHLCYVFGQCYNVVLTKMNNTWIKTSPAGPIFVMCFHKQNLTFEWSDFLEKNKGTLQVVSNVKGPQFQNFTLKCCFLTCGCYPKMGQHFNFIYKCFGGLHQRRKCYIDHSTLRDTNFATINLGNNQL